MLFDMAHHFGIDVVELAGNRLEQRLDTRARHRADQTQTLALGQLHGHKLTPAGDQGVCQSGMAVGIVADVGQLGRQSRSQTSHIDMRTGNVDTHHHR